MKDMHQNTVSPEDIDLRVDAMGLACPLPLLKAKQGLSALACEQVLSIDVSDPGSVRDFHAFIDLTSHTMLAFLEQGNHYTYIIKKGE